MQLLRHTVLSAQPPTLYKISAQGVVEVVKVESMSANLEQEPKRRVTAPTVGTRTKPVGVNEPTL